MFVVTLKLNGEVAMQSDHDYRPYAESQADIWRRMYPHASVTIREEKEKTK